METLGQAEPYFVKCIRSNAEKVRMSLEWELLAWLTSNQTLKSFWGGYVEVKSCL